MKWLRRKKQSGCRRRESGSCYGFSTLAEQRSGFRGDNAKLHTSAHCEDLRIFPRLLPRSEPCTAAKKVLEYSRVQVPSIARASSAPSLVRGSTARPSERERENHSPSMPHNTWGAHEARRLDTPLKPCQKRSLGDLSDLEPVRCGVLLCWDLGHLGCRPCQARVAELRASVQHEFRLRFFCEAVPGGTSDGKGPRRGGL